MLPGLELSYMLSCLSLATRQSITQVHLPEVAATLASLEARRRQDEHALPSGWWDGALLLSPLADSGTLLILCNHRILFGPLLEGRPPTLSLPARSAGEGRAV